MILAVTYLVFVVIAVVTLWGDAAVGLPAWVTVVRLAVLAGVAAVLPAGSMWLTVRSRIGGRRPYLLADENGRGAALMTARIKRRDGRATVELESHMAVQRPRESSSAHESRLPYGRVLRLAMATEHLPVLDGTGTWLRIKTRSEKVARLYLEDFPGLEEIARNRWGKILLERRPT